MQIWRELLETQLRLSTSQEYEQNGSFYGNGRTYEVHEPILCLEYVLEAI